MKRMILLKNIWLVKKRVKQLINKNNISQDLLLRVSQTYDATQYPLKRDFFLTQLFWWSAARA